MNPVTAPLVATLLLLVFTMVAAVDGLYFHLFRYRLHMRPDSIYEHALHTANACLFPVVTWLLFVTNASGVALWTALGLTVATFGIELLDVACERASRASLGGLTSGESTMHFGMALLRATFTAVLMTAKPGDCWSLAAPLSLEGPLPPFSRAAGLTVATVGVPIALLHVALLAQALAKKGNSWSDATV